LPHRLIVLLIIFASGKDQNTPITTQCIASSKSNNLPPLCCHLHLFSSSKATQLEDQNTHTFAAQVDCSFNFFASSKRPKYPHYNTMASLLVKVATFLLFVVIFLLLVIIIIFLLFVISLLLAKQCNGKTKIPTLLPHRLIVLLIFCCFWQKTKIPHYNMMASLLAKATTFLLFLIIVIFRLFVILIIIFLLFVLSCFWQSNTTGKTKIPTHLQHRLIVLLFFCFWQKTPIPDGIASGKSNNLPPLCCHVPLFIFLLLVIIIIFLLFIKFLLATKQHD